MAPDDFSVISYKILDYSYECLKKGVEPSWAKAQELAKCNDVYFEAVVRSLMDSGLIAESRPFKDMNGDVVGWSDGLRVTLQGTEFLNENSAMGKARRFLGAAWKAVLAGAVGATMAL